VFYVHHAAGLDGRGTGSYIDQIICRERKVLYSGALGNIEPVGEDPSPSAPANERLYYCQNRRADVVAMVNSSGRQVEQARYSSCGVPFGLPAGDADSDGDVDAADLSQIQSWIDASSYDVRGDSDLDGDVDGTDKFLANAISGTTLGRGVLTRNSTANRFGYAGYFYHGTVLKYHVRNRVYDPYLGRWITRDPIEYNAGVMNVYEYVGSAPLRWWDPEGLGPDGKWPPDNLLTKPPSDYHPLAPLVEDPVRCIGPDRVLTCTGGPGHIPGIGQGPTRDAIVLCCDVVSIVAPGGAVVRVVTCGGKGLRAIKTGSTANRYTRIERIRKWIRYDRPHHLKPRQWDGIIPNTIRKRFRKWFGAGS